MKRNSRNDEISAENEVIERTCSYCKWFECYEGVCFNGESEHCAEFMWQDDNSCDKWEGK